MSICRLCDGTGEVMLFNKGRLLMSGCPRCISKERDSAEAKLARVREALKDVTHLVAFLVRAAKASDRQLNRCLSDVELFHIVQGVAKEALAGGDK